MAILTSPAVDRRGTEPNVPKQGRRRSLVVELLAHTQASFYLVLVPAVLLLALGMMMAIFGQIPLNDGIVGKYVADEYRARVLSVRYVVSLGVASIAVPMIALLHRTEGGFRNVFMVLVALACAIFVSALFFPSRRSIAQGSQEQTA